MDFESSGCAFDPRRGHTIENRLLVLDYFFYMLSLIEIKKLYRTICWQPSQLIPFTSRKDKNNNEQNQ